MFSKNQVRENTITEFRKGIILYKPIKVYLFSLAERNSLDRWIDKELRKLLK